MNHGDEVNDDIPKTNKKSTYLILKMRGKTMCYDGWPIGVIAD